MRDNGKSDTMSALFQAMCGNDWDQSFISDALKSSSLAVFYASSAKQLSLALANRAIILYSLGLINEAIYDANEAIKTPMSRISLVKTFICLGQCYRCKGKFRTAKQCFKIALGVLGQNKQDEYRHLMQHALRGLEKCYEAKTLVHSTVSKSLWKSYQPEPPEIKMGRNEGSAEDTSKVFCSLLASNGSLRLKNAGPEYGWTLEVTRDVQAGEFLLVEKAYAASLSKRRTKYCYSCFRSCLNLIPCRGCPHVGFCSTICAENALNLDKRRLLGVNGHIHDCNGVLPCLLLDRFSPKSEVTLEITGSPTLAHLAYSIIANTDPQRLLDYICSTGDYQGGRGHQAFVGSDFVRAIPPTVFDPSDYSSVAWLVTCSDKVDVYRRWQYTVAAIFLTYCLFVGGYQMDWREDSWGTEEMVKNLPSPTNRPKCVPACWAAACLLYHLQSADITTFRLNDRIGQDVRRLDSGYVNLGFIIYPTISLINHSCNPSALVAPSSRGFAGILTLKPLSVGSEISVAYNSKYSFDSGLIRRCNLKFIFHFDCKCEACSNGWMLKNEQTETLICPDCNNQFSSTESACPRCSSPCGVESYKKFLQPIRRFMGYYMNNDLVTSKLVERGLNLLRVAQSLIAPPSITLLTLEEAFENLIYHEYGPWTLRSWQDSL